MLLLCYIKKRNFANLRGCSCLSCTNQANSAPMYYMMLWY